MTFREAKAQGYKAGRMAYQRGYVSRKINIDDQPVIFTKRGAAYILIPNWKSTQYCIRLYLEIPEKSNIFGHESKKTKGGLILINPK